MRTAPRESAREADRVRLAGLPLETRGLGGRVGDDLRRKPGQACDVHTVALRAKAGAKLVEEPLVYKVEL